MTESDPRRRRDPSSMSRARRYTPRGRTVREAAEGSEDNRARENGARDREAARRERHRTSQEPNPTEDLAALRRREAAARSRERRLRETGTAEAEPHTPRTRSKAANSRATGSVKAEPVRRTGRSAPSRRTGTVNPQRRGATSRATGPVPVRPLKHLPRLGNPSRRMRMAAAFVMILLVASGARLVQLQVTDSAAFAAEALNQRMTTEPLPAERGAILDRDDNRLAYSMGANYIAVDPVMVKGDAAQLAAALGPLLGRPASELEPIIETKETPQGDEIRFAYLQRGVDLAIGDEIRELANPGLIIGDDERRVVPGRDLAANVIGFTGEEGGGLGGLEATYDDWLSGTDGEVSYERSQSGQPIPGAFYREQEAVPGNGIKLTLDADLQFKVQSILEATVTEHDAAFGSAMVMEVGTGEMLAMASTPTYDAANPFDVDDEEVYRDYGTQATVDPGSIHKAIVFAAALEEGCIEPDGTMPVEQSINKGGTWYEDGYQHGDAVLSLAGIIAQSSNVGTIQLADCLGPEKLYEYQLAFGLGQPSGVGIAGEAAGILQPPELWSGTSPGSVPIGHEGTATIMQMAAVYAAIANDGVYVQPTLVDHLIDADGNAVEPEEEPATHRVVSQETAESLQYLLQAPIVDETGTGRNAQLENYHLAGKTGTGSLVVDGEYAEGNVTSFVGFAPAEDPQYVVAVSVYVPSGGGGGSTTGEAFKEINEFALAHFGVRPATGPPPEFDVWG